ncbi:MAG TPA: bacillithiol biosynthesis cysteine-adding enzyme BshC [Bryobacteraceae bacterium]|nr:bacillithiol biosynthesis cysteine-adding enzyme BshC [Bryobacteraceae bacterium]
MHCSCVRQTELPHTSRLFADVLYHPDRTTAFYRHPYRDLENVRRAAAEVRLAPERRTALVAALAAQNPASSALEKLARPETVAVVTGQQVGLFSGPAYTIYKALTAVKLAATLSESGVPAVPVFWLATEDHDFAEVNHSWVFGPGHQSRKLEMQSSASGQPVGGVALASPPIDALREALRGLPFADEVSELAAETYRAGSTIGEAFGALLRRILGRFEILQVDPMARVFRELAAPALRMAVESAAELTEGLLERNRELAAAGYHAQVHIEPQTSLVFLLENGKRLVLRRQGREYALNGRRFSSEELMDRAASLSPNALLRPVVQDSMLPTAAYIGGPAEVAYLAQSDVIYQRLLGRSPVAMPRAGFTVLDDHSEKLMDRYGLRLQGFFQGEDAVRAQISFALVPPAVGRATRDAVEAVESAADRLSRELRGFDPTLSQALERSRRKILYQIGKIERKTGREALRRDARAAEDARSLCSLIYPERHLQERFYSILPLLAKHGLDLVDQVYESVQLDCPDHRLLVL